MKKLKYALTLLSAFLLITARMVCLAEKNASEETEPVHQLTLEGAEQNALAPEVIHGSSGETITSAYIKKGSEIPGRIDVIRWDGDKQTTLDHWSEGILGTTSGEKLFCADPTQHFEEGLIMTSCNALEYYSQDTIDTVCALLYYMDNYGCPRLTEDHKYMMKQTFLWTALNQVSDWYTGGDYVEICYGIGLTCSCGHNVAGHYRDHYASAIQWLAENKERFEASGEIFTNQGSQPLSRWTYQFHPAGYAALRKRSASPPLTEDNSCYSLKGAEYGVYKDQACSIRTGTLITDSSGNSGAVEVDPGKYYIKETKASPGYALDPTVYTVTVKENKTTTLTVKEIPLNHPIRILLKKTDSETSGGSPQGGASLSGAEFTVRFYGGLYSSDPAEKGAKPLRTWVMKTDSGGNITFDAASRVSGDQFYLSDGKAVLPLGTVTIQETKAPEGYLPNDRVFTQQITARENSITAYDQPDIPEDVIRGGVRIEKWDSETDSRKAQGGATLQGAEFRIISLNDAPVIVNGISYVKNDTVASLTTDKTGAAWTSADLLPYGAYRVEEIEAPEGYNPSGTLSREFHIRQDGKTVNLSTASTAIKNEIIRGDIQIIKFSEPLDEEADRMSPLEGIVFELTSKTTGEVFRITTDENGCASTTQLQISSRGNLVYDTYTVHEKNPPKGLTPVDDFDVTISEEGQTLHYILEDRQILSPIRLLKTDSTTGQTIPIAGALFQLLDKNKEPVTMTTYYPDKIIHDSFETDENGSFLLPEKLPAGIYYFREISAPAGYLSGEDLRFEITEGKDWAEPLTVKYENAPAEGRIRIIKTDGETGDRLSDVEFTVTAAEDIVTGDGTIRAKKGQTVDTLITDENGTAESRALYLGKYTVTETKPPTGYAGSEAPRTVDLQYAGQDTPVVTEVLKIENQKTMISQTNAVSADTGTRLGIAREDAVIRDSVNMIRLHIGQEYLLRAELIDTETGEPLKNANGEPISAEKTFTADASDMEIEIEIPLDASALAGRTVTVFDTLYIGDTEAAAHRDISAESQQVTFPEHQIRTTALGELTQTHDLPSAADAVIIDTVSYQGLIPDLEYELRGTVIDRETGKPCLENNEELWFSQTFIPESDTGTVEMRFSLDTSGLAGKEFVIFEYLWQDGDLVTSHEDPSDKDQTVRVLSPEEVKKEIPETGDDAGITSLAALTGLTGLAAITGAGAYLASRRRRRSSRRHRYSKNNH